MSLQQSRFGGRLLQGLLCFPSVAAFEAWLSGRREAGDFHFVKAQTHKPKRKKGERPLAETPLEARSAQEGAAASETDALASEPWVSTVTYKCRHWQAPENFVSFWKKRQRDLHGEEEASLLGELCLQRVQQLNRRLKSRVKQAALLGIAPEALFSDEALRSHAGRRPRKDVASFQELQKARDAQREAQQRVAARLEALGDPEVRLRLSDLRRRRNQRRRREASAGKAAADDFEEAPQETPAETSPQKTAAVGSRDAEKGPPETRSVFESPASWAFPTQLAEAAPSEGDGQDSSVSDEEEANPKDKAQQGLHQPTGGESEDVVFDAYTRRKLAMRRELRQVPHCNCPAFLRFRFLSNGKVLLIAGNEAHSSECLKNRSVPFKLPESILSFILRNKQLSPSTLVRCCANPALSRQLIRDAPPLAFPLTEKAVENCLYRAKQKAQQRKLEEAQATPRAELRRSASNQQVQEPTAVQTSSPPLKPKKQTAAERWQELYNKLENQLHQREAVLRERASLLKQGGPKKRERERSLELEMELHALKEALQERDLPARERMYMKRREERVRQALDVYWRRQKQEAARNARALSRQRRRLLEKD